MIDVFREAREHVTAEAAARNYGLEIRRNHTALCPFHREKTPSLRFKDGRYKCFGCGVGGDSIDYTSRLLGLDAMGAVRRLNDDFMLGLPLDRGPTREERKAAEHRREVAEKHKAFEEWRDRFVVALCEAIREGNIALKEVTDLDKLSDQQADAIMMNPIFEYWCDTLSYGTPEEQLFVYRERGQIAHWIEKVLMPC